MLMREYTHASNQILIRHIRHRDMIAICMRTVKLFTRLHGMRLRAHERRATPPITSHSMAERKISSTRSLPSHTMPKPPLMLFRYLRHLHCARPPSSCHAHSFRQNTVRHICHDITAVLDIGCFTEWRVCTADIVMVASQHDGADSPLRTIH